VGTVRAAEKRAIVFNPVADNAAATMGAGRGQLMHSAFKRIENVRVALRRRHGKRFVVVVSAYFTFSHSFLPSIQTMVAQGEERGCDRNHKSQVTAGKRK
jgi:hypothetical protein